MTIPLPSGAEARTRNAGAPLAAILVNGGSARPLPGTWSATSELLATRLAPGLGGFSFTEVRYRVKSWQALDSCIEDALTAVEHVVAGGARTVVFVGFSMGGAVSLAAADHPQVAGVVGLAPWIPDRLPLDGIRGKRLDVIHGTWDRYLPGIPGVSATSSRRGFERAVAAGATGTYRLIARGMHGAALRHPWRGLVRLPRWRAWVDETAVALGRYAV
ncbi:MAG: alpha/beta fold hydrolase [Gaiella sp.]